MSMTTIITYYMHAHIHTYIHTYAPTPFSKRKQHINLSWVMTREVLSEYLYGYMDHNSEAGCLYT